MAIMRYLTKNEEVSADDKALIGDYIAAYEKVEKFEKMDSIDSIFKKYSSLLNEYLSENMGLPYLK